MNARFHRAASAEGLFSPTAQAARVSLDQACCCVARAVVRVVMPPTPDRPHETELLLCGHHYRVARGALAAAGARVKELPGSGADTTAWLHDDRARSYAMAGKG